MSDETSSKPDQTIVFWVYLFMFILSVICSLFILSQFFVKPTLRKRLHNHIILIVVTCSFIQVICELPFVLAFFRNQTALYPSYLFCTIWCLIDYPFNVIILMLICYGSIERYLLVFHRNMITNHLILLHYLPIAFCLIYPCVFYIGMICFYPCTQQYDYTQITCQGPCYLFEQIPGSADLLINMATPMTICVIVNLTIIIRVLHKKHRMKQQRKWKKNRFLVLQLMSIVFAHNLVWLPIILSLLYTLFSPVVEQAIIDLSVNMFTYSIYIVIMICPFISLGGLTDLHPTIYSNLCGRIQRQQSRVQPITHTPAGYI